MRRSVLLAALSLLAIVAFGLYRLESDVRDMERQLAALNAELLREEQTIHVLSAEWAYLNGPDRLQDLAARHLTLTPVLPSQITRLDKLPISPEPDLAARRQPERAPKTGLYL